MKFLDEVKIYISSGNGGPGCISFRREANVPKGGPDGGNGGDGGNVIIKTVDNLNTLIDYRYKQHFKAKSGQHGMGKNRNGHNADDIILKVPFGTEILNEDKNVKLADLVDKDDNIILAKGGIGGKGNAFFKSSTNQSPRHAQPGEKGEEKTIWLRLKLIADVGLVGLPNAGKSTFLSKISSSRPKIADYPFTTLYPNLGVNRTDEKEFVVADIPGLIEDAHIGKGLGHKFLGHIERCKILLHLIDITNKNIIESFQVIENELKAYNEKVYNKDQILVFTKCDAFNKKKLNDIKKNINGINVENAFFISSVTGFNIDSLCRKVNEMINNDKEKDDDNFDQKSSTWEP